MCSREKGPLVTNKDIAEYLEMRAQAAMASKELKSTSICSGYDTESNPFGDSNLTQIFVWHKKIEHNVDHGVPILLEDMFSRKRQKERMEEIEKGKKRREEKATTERAKRVEDMAKLARERAREEFLEWEKNEEDFFSRQSKNRVLDQGTALSEPQDNNIEMEMEMEMRRGGAMKAMGETKEDDSVLEVKMDSEHLIRMPNYFNRVHTGYDWNKYNQVHYDYENPPPKTVKGYRFNIFYPDLIDKSKATSYTTEKDNSVDPET